MESLNIFRNSYPLKLLPIKTLDQMYKALVRSASNSQINLGVTLNSLMEKVERTQYQTALAITGTWQGTNSSKHYEELGWESLSDRRWCRRILEIHKIEKYKTPSFLDINYLHTVDPCIDLITIIPFKK